MKRQHSIVPLAHVPLDMLGFVRYCFYCLCPKHPKEVKAVAAVVVEGLNQFYGICGHHAEVYPLTEEQEQQSPMVCIDCFPLS